MRAFIEQLAGPQVKQENKTVRPQDRRGQHSDKSGGQHPGLLLQRYLCENATGDGGNPEEKRAILQAAINAAKNADVQSLYRAAFARWSKSLPNDPAPVDLATQGRLIVGLGTENVLETGIRLHHTYGMPIIPGSALKGLAAHYCDQVWGERDNSNPSDEAIQFRSPRKEDRKNDCEAEPQGEYHNLLFGATDESGYVIFHDAWLVPDSDKEPLKLDVMTPHHSGWNDIKNPEPPTDFDSPVPVPFLSVTGTFCVAVSWHGPAHNQALNWTELALALLRDALFDWGVGGKTSSGYGRFDRERWEKEETHRQQKSAKRQKEVEEAAALAVMSPIERKIKEYLDLHPNKADTRDWLKLYQELKNPNGRFQEREEQVEIARMVKQGMQDAKVWKDKKKDGDRKKYIEGILGE